MASWEADLSLPSEYATNYAFITAYLWQINDERGVLNRFVYLTDNNKLRVTFLTTGNWNDGESTYAGRIVALFYKRNFPNA